MKYKEYCETCEDEPEMNLICSWISGTGMTFSLYQCPQCKEISNSMADKPLNIERGTCPRCGSENPTEEKIALACPQFTCPDCGLIFREVPVKNNKTIAKKPTSEGSK